MNTPKGLDLSTVTVSALVGALRTIHADPNTIGGVANFDTVDDVVGTDCWTPEQEMEIVDALRIL